MVILGYEIVSCDYTITFFSQLLPKNWGESEPKHQLLQVPISGYNHHFVAKPAIVADSVEKEKIWKEQTDRKTHHNNEKTECEHMTYRMK